MAIRNPALEDFIKPLRTNRSTLHQLMREFCITFRHLAANSPAQFLPTPVFESTLRPVRSRDEGVYLAIDIGGSNLRVAFVQLFPDALSDDHGGSYANGDHSPHRYLRRIHEKAWPIGEHLKNENADRLFNWIGRCITQVVQVGEKDLSLHLPQEIPMGVTFSFPMAQECLSQATLMPMGKGFAITSNLDLGYHLLSGYEKNRGSLPRIQIAAILNDSVATMASFMYQNPETATAKPAMGLILGTGTNATIPMRLSALHQSKASSIKQPPPDQVDEDPKIAVNTEWSINGSVPPMQKLGLITRWDKEVDEAGEAPGFQPLEYMTAGRYLGELCRRVFVDYLTSVRGYRVDALPEKMKTKFGVTTTFLSFYRPDDGPPLKERLNQEFRGMLEWTDDLALDLYEIALAAEARAALIIAAAIVALLQSAEYIRPRKGTESKDLVVGYTGGCITKFQRYLEDTQKFLQEVLEMEYGPDPPIRVLLKPCHDGGIEGAGILAGVSKGYPGR